MLNLKKETKIEIFFWLVVVFVFSPRVLLEYYEHKLKTSLIPFENNEWTVKDKEGNVIYENLTLPYDLRWKEQKTNRREWIFEKEVKTEKLISTDNLGIVLGRIGDADIFQINNCIIGSTAYNPSVFQIEGWGWSLLRYYKVPQSCLTAPSSKMKLRVIKVYGPGYGVIAHPIGFGQYSYIQKLVKILDFYRYTVIAIFGLGLILFIGVNYFFIYLISDRRENYGIFSLLSVFVGVYLLMTSVYPFLMIPSIALCVKILFGSAFISTVLFLLFFHQKFGVFNKKYFLIYLLFCLPLFISAMFVAGSESVYKLYESWQPLFLIAFLICYFQMLHPRLKSSGDLYYKKYILSFSIFIFCCFHDVIVSIFSITNSYLIGYAFTFFVLVVGLTLSREYSDAFSKVEDLVVQRTGQLNQALVGIQEAQKQKEDQAKRFAHDIRSPLAALQVLKDVALYQLSEDAKSLFKHTIVRINDLANTALPKLIGQDAEQNIKTSVFLWPVLDKLVSEKRLEYGHLPDFSIELKNISPILELHALCEEIELNRIVSNLINNSVEARRVNEPLQIYLTIQKINNLIQIELIDNGSGIPDTNLSKIFDAGYSHGKKGGKGIGLKHAKSTIESWNGKIQLTSKVDQGTRILLEIPSSGKPDWLLTKLNLNQIDNLVIIDDQPFVVDAWRQKLQELSSQPNIYWIQNRSAWDQSEIPTLDRTKTFFLVDHDLSSSITGLDMIKELKLNQRVVLVTGNDDDLSLRKRAMDLSILILPKSLIHTIPIEVA